MPTRVFVTEEFARFARKARIADDALVEAIDRADRGLVDADLGGGLLKLRIARPNESRSHGLRTLVAYVREGKAFFVYGFAKNDAANVSGPAERAFRVYGGELQGLDEAGVAANVARGRLREIER